MDSSRHRREQQGQPAQRDARQELAANLRRAFPLDPAGSFTSLLRALDEPSR
jgi:hypothetical protein